MGLLNHILTTDDFVTKKFSSENITVLEGNDKDLNFIMKFQEEVMIYIIQPNEIRIKEIVQIHTILATTIQNLKEYIIFIPCENYEIIKILKSYHIMECLHIENLNFDLIPIDIDLLSLENENCLKEIYIDEDLSSISDLANSLTKLEMIFGKVKYKYIKGDMGLKFCQILEEKEKENNLKDSGELLGLLAFDRSVDFITLMNTNYTFEGIIDDKFGISLGRIKVSEKLLKENLTKKPITNDKLISYKLTSPYNPFYCSLRCMHYLDTIKYICKIREYYKNISDKNKKMKDKMSLADLRNITNEVNFYVSKIKDSLIMNENIVNHITKALQDPNHVKYITKEQMLLAGDYPNNLHDYYDELLCEKKDFLKLIRLMIIESLTQNGIKDYNKLRREILNIYGFQHIFLIRNLEILGWFKEKQILKNIKKNMITLTLNQINEKLDLINLNYSPINITDCSYVLGGYCPLSLKIVEKAVEGKWHTIIDILKKLPGATIYPEDESEINNPQKDKNIIFLVFIGGITYTEIEGIRYLNRKFSEENKNGKRKKTQFIILTTGILNSNKIFSSLSKEINTSSFNFKKFYEQANPNTDKKDKK